MVKEFKVYYGNVPASQEQLNAIEEIVVEQEIGRAWQARITIPICIAEDGSWDGENNPEYAELARVRVEARVGEGDFVPLIDGRIVDQDPGMSAEPGASTLTLTVHDDTTLFHREAGSEDFPPGQSDSDIARSLLTDAALGGTVEVDETGAATDPNAVVQRHGTPMQLLRSLMQRHAEFYAYVVPGSVPGTSDCFFKKLPETPDPSLPILVLTGPGRNINGFHVQRVSNSAALYEGAWLSMDDKSVSTGSARSSDTAVSEGETATAAESSEIRTRRLPHGIGDHLSPSEAAEGLARQSSYTIRAEGTVLPQCFRGILLPYRMIRANVSNSRYSAKYVIFKVTHTLGISEYTQSFSLRGNAVTPETSANALSPAAAVAIGAAAVSFNIQADIF